MSRGFEVFAAGRFVECRWSLAEACGCAREAAAGAPGVKYTIERDGEQCASYELTGPGRLKVWVR